MFAVSECIQGATYQAITNSNADVVVAPRYFSDEFKLFYFVCHLSMLVYGVPKI